MTTPEEAKRMYEFLRDKLILLLEEMESDLEGGTIWVREADFNDHKLVVTVAYDKEKHERYAQWWLDGQPVDNNHLINDVLNLPCQ